MRALTLSQPWASLVALQHKRYETRSWPIRVIDCERTEDIEMAVSGLERHLGNFGFGRYAWKFASNVWVPAEPIPYRGAQGLWDFPDALLEGYSR